MTPVGSKLIDLAFSFSYLIVRFWGWEENAREQAKNKIEMDARAAAGLPAYGEPTMDETAQAVAARNSKYAALKFCKSFLPQSRFCIAGSFFIWLT